jgi:hypothetical protein
MLRLTEGFLLEGILVSMVVALIIFLIWNDPEWTIRGLLVRLFLLACTPFALCAWACWKLVGFALWLYDLISDICRRKIPHG